MGIKDYKKVAHLLYVATSNFHSGLKTATMPNDEILAIKGSKRGVQLRWAHFKWYKTIFGVVMDNRKPSPTSSFNI